MKKKQLYIIIFLLVCFFSLYDTCLSSARSYTITPIATSTYHEGYPDINNNDEIVWYAFDGFDTEIFLYDGSDIIGFCSWGSGT